MSGRLPDPASRDEAEGIPDQQELTAAQQATGQDEGVLEPPHDTALAVEDFGTTPAEQHEGESLDGRLARELPDTPVAVEQDAVGRLVAPDEGVHEDTEKDLLAMDVGTDLGGPSAEEAAMHLEPQSFEAQR